MIGPWFLWKLIVDQQHQHNGYRAAIVRLVADLVRAEGANELLTSYTEGPGDPGPFYRRLRFVPPAMVTFTARRSSLSVSIGSATLH